MVSWMYMYIDKSTSFHSKLSWYGTSLFKVVHGFWPDYIEVTFPTDNNVFLTYCIQCCLCVESFIILWFSTKFLLTVSHSWNSWLDPLFWLGFKRRLDHSDLYAHPLEADSKLLLTLFNRFVQYQYSHLLYRTSPVGSTGWELECCPSEKILCYSFLDLSISFIGHWKEATVPCNYAFLL